MASHSVATSERSYYQIDLDTNRTYLQTEDLDDHVIPGWLQKLGVSLAPVAAAQPRKAYAYRKMCEAEFEEVKRIRGVPTTVAGGERMRGRQEKWFTESLDHTRQFQNRGVRDPEVVAEFGLDRKGYHEHVRDKHIGNDADMKKVINQHSNEPRRGRNFYNRERLGQRPDGKVNVGLKGPRNVEAFNRQVFSVKKIDPNSFMNKKSALRWLRRNKMTAVFGALGVFFDVAAITISVIEDGGEFGRSTTLTLADIAGGAVGAAVGTAVAGSALGTAVAATAIGSAIGSIIPGIGTVICGFIGAIIGSLIASGITSFFLGYNPVAPGPGPPLLDTDPREAVFLPPQLDQEGSAATMEPPSDVDTQYSGFPDTEWSTDEGLEFPEMDYDT